MQQQIRMERLASGNSALKNKRIADVRGGPCSRAEMKSKEKIHPELRSRARWMAGKSLWGHTHRTWRKCVLQGGRESCSQGCPSAAVSHRVAEGSSGKRCLQGLAGHCALEKLGLGSPCLVGLGLLKLCAREPSRDLCKLHPFSWTLYWQSLKSCQLGQEVQSEGLAIFLQRKQ